MTFFGFYYLLYRPFFFLPSHTHVHTHTCTQETKQRATLLCLLFFFFFLSFPALLLSICFLFHTQNSKHLLTPASQPIPSPPSFPSSTPFPPFFPSPSRLGCVVSSPSYHLPGEEVRHLHKESMVGVFNQRPHYPHQGLSWS